MGLSYKRSSEIQLHSENGTKSTYSYSSHILPFSNHPLSSHVSSSSCLQCTSPDKNSIISLFTYYQRTFLLPIGLFIIPLHHTVCKLFSQSILTHQYRVLHVKCFNIYTRDSQIICYLNRKF